MKDQAKSRLVDAVLQDRKIMLVRNGPTRRIVGRLRSPDISTQFSLDICEWVVKQYTIGSTEITPVKAMLFIENNVK